MNAHQFHQSWGPDPVPDFHEPPTRTTAVPDAFKVLDFARDLGADRPDVDLFALIAERLHGEPERIVLGLTVEYSEGVLSARLVLGLPVRLDDEDTE